MDNKICLSCRFGSVQIEVLVPETCDLEKFVTETRNFASDVIAVTKEKTHSLLIHFSVRAGLSRISFQSALHLHSKCEQK